MNSEALRRKAARGIRVMSDEATVYRPVMNDFGERTGYGFVTRLRGQYYQGGYFSGRNAYANATLRLSGQTVSRQAEKFMAAADEDSAKVEIGDFFLLIGRMYEVVDWNVGARVFYDFSLSRAALPLPEMKEEKV